MKYILFLAILFICHITSAQTYGALQGDATCGCEILIYTIQDPVLPPNQPDLEPDPHTQTGGPSSVGYLDNFMQSIRGDCDRSVYVKVRKVKTIGIEYYYDYLVNDVYTLMERYKDYSTICFKGYFDFSQTIDITFGQVVKLLGETEFTYTGDGIDPEISFEGTGAGLQGGKIVTSVPMNNGMITIDSQGSVKGGNSQNRLYNQIKDTKLVQENTNTFGPNADARQDRGILLSNSFESIISQRDNGANFYANINNVEIQGFGVGMHCRGWSNAAMIRDLKFNNISAYGIWVSGGADNSFTNINYNGCTGHAIRIDNYIDYRYSDYVADPNNRIEILHQTC